MFRTEGWHYLKGYLETQFSLIVDCALKSTKVEEIYKAQGGCKFYNQLYENIQKYLDVPELEEEDNNEMV